MPDTPPATALPPVPPVDRAAGDHTLALHALNVLRAELKGMTFRNTESRHGRVAYQAPRCPALPRDGTVTDSTSMSRISGSVRKEVMSVNDSDQLVAEAAARLQKAFDWIDISTGDGADFRVVAAVALGITPAQVDVEECMGLGWADE